MNSIRAPATTMLSRTILRSVETCLRVGTDEVKVGCLPGPSRRDAERLFGATAEKRACPELRPTVQPGVPRRSSGFHRLPARSRSVASERAPSWLSTGTRAADGVRLVGLSTSVAKVDYLPVPMLALPCVRG